MPLNLKTVCFRTADRTKKILKFENIDAFLLKCLLMQKLHIQKAPNTPEIKFSPDENIFLISGTSSPEDVRALYYPVIEWVRIFVDDVIDGVFNNFNKNNPIVLIIDLAYFNSSSAKFFYDILSELKRIPQDTYPVIVNWYYDPEDIDMKDAGSDIATLVEMEFHFIAKPKS
jgi:SiaC family regulatory phosphoprotein